MYQIQRSCVISRVPESRKVIAVLLKISGTCELSCQQSRIFSDMVGPPDPKSNLRPYKYHIPHSETPEELNFRLKRDELHKWNQTFWASHNEEFAKAKEKFVHQRIHEKYVDNPSNSTRVLTSDDMSVFYKKFLDENKTRHAAYNREWYQRNLSLLWPALKISIRRLFEKS